MRNLMRLSGFAATVFFVLLYVTSAHAQATRTWVSGVGDDANPCSRTAPCKTFAGAITKTVSGGEIDCLDPGGFGAVFINKPITIDCAGGPGGQVGAILNSGENGIIVDIPSGTVKIRNMTINGAGTGVCGILFENGGSLIVEHVGIFGQLSSGGTAAGVAVEPTGAATVDMLDVEVQFGSADGILIKPGTNGSAKVTLNRVSSLHNKGGGIRVDNTGLTTGTGSNVTIFQSAFNGNGTGIEALSPAGTVAATIEMTNSMSSQNSAFGLLASGPNAVISVGGSTVAGNLTGLAAGGSGQVKSFGDNYFVGNGSNGTPSGTNLGKL